MQMLLLKKMLTKIFLPSNTGLTVIKKKDVNIFYIYNTFYFYKLAFKKLGYKDVLDKETNGICVYAPAVNNYKFYLKLLSNFLFSWNFYFFKKIKFTGKGYRITFRKKKKTIIFYFGHSHDTTILFRSVFIKKPHKYKFVIFKNSIKKINKLANMIVKIKPMNFYTKRGIRNSRQIIFKRKGKKNAY